MWQRAGCRLRQVANIIAFFPEFRYEYDLKQMSPPSWSPSPSTSSTSSTTSFRTMNTAVPAAAPAPPSGYVCDTLPPPKLASASGTGPQSRSPSPVPPPTPPTTVFKAAAILDNSQSRQPHASSSRRQLSEPTESFAAQLAPPGRKLCVRHQRMADEDTNLKLQQVSILFVLFRR